MKRRVIQIANSTQLVSLPRKWAVQHGIKKGDEVEVKEEGNSILISVDSEIAVEKTSIDFRGKYHIIHRALSALYKKGYDEIEIIFDSTEELSMIISTIEKEFIGFEVVEQGKNSLVAKNVSKIEYGEFNSIIKRLWFSLISMAEDSLEAAKNPNDVDLKNIALRDTNINKLTDFCRRSLNKGGVKTKHPNLIYHIVEELEKIGDEYKYICHHLAKKKVKLKPKILGLYKEINDYLRGFYNLFYNFTLDKMTEFIVNSKEFRKKFDEMGDQFSKEDGKIILHLYNTLNHIFDMNGPLMASKL